jgi:hypothetical protein
MKLPLFWVDNPRMWFQTAEAQFRIKGITRSMTKFDHVLARIPSELTISLADVMEAALSTVNPCPDPYTELKDRLLEATLPGPYKMLDSLLDHPALGDRRPSKMMDEMLNLLPPKVIPDLLFNALFLRRLPAGLRQVLAVQKHETQRALAKAADELFDSGAPAAAAGVANLATEDEACALPIVPPHRGRSPPRSSFTRSAPPARMCFFHAKYAERAQKCESPCSWSGNVVGGGRSRRRN